MTRDVARDALRWVTTRAVELPDPRERAAVLQAAHVVLAAIDLLEEP